MQYMGFTFATTQVPVCLIWLFSKSNYRAMWNWSNNWWWSCDGQSIFRVIFACGITWYHILRVQLVSYLHITNTKRSLNIFISCSILFSKIRLVGTSWYMKPMPMIFLFSTTCDLLYNMWEFFWKPSMVRKWTNLIKSFTIYVPPSVIHWLWWYIVTFETIENEHLPIDFVIKYWEYPAQTFVNIYHGCWYG